MTNNLQQKNHKSAFLIILAVAITMVIVYFGVFNHQKPNGTHVKINGVFLPEAKDVADFQLIDNHGNLLTKKTLQGHWTMMFFGFTNCSYICPTTLAALNKMYKTLQQELPDNQLPQVLFVTVDPDRDTVQRLNSYMNSFNSHFIGAREKNDLDTEELEKQMHVVAIKTPTHDKKNYNVDHSAEIIVLNPSTKVQAFMSYPHQPEEMVKDYKLILMNS